MSDLTFQWYTIKIAPSDTVDEIVQKLVRKGADPKEFPNSVYVIRLASKFLIQYSPKKFSPVIYIGEGRLRNRLDKHRRWLTDLQKLLPQASFEVKVCFPRSARSTALNRPYEAHLLLQFCKQFGQLPLRNRKQQLIDEGINFSRTGRQQALGPGTGKKYTWAIKPLPAQVAFTKFAD